jgi:outer membrane protein TolC
MSLLLLGVAAAIAAAQQPVTTPVPLTLEEAIAIAEQNAYSIKIAESNVEISRQRLSQARGQLGPKVTATGNYNRILNDPRFDTGQGTTVGIEKNNASIGASVTMPLDITGNLSKLARAAGSTVEASKETAEATRNDVRLAVKRAYFNVLRSEGLVRVAEQSLTAAKERAAQGELLFQGAQIARVDLERLRTLVAQSEGDLANAQNGLQIQKNLFNFTLARPVESPVVLVDPTSLPPSPVNPEPLVTAAQAQRPEVRSLLFTQQALAAVTRAQEGGMLPSIGVGLNYSRQLVGQSFNGGGGNENATASLNLSVPIFDSGITRARVKEARQNEEQARINLEQLRLGISQEVRNALTNLESARARLDAAERQVALAEEVFRLAVIRQQAGEATYVEIVDAQTQLTQARNLVVSARYDYLTAYSELQRALGTDSVPAGPATVVPGDRNT